MAGWQSFLPVQQIRCMAGTAAVFTVSEVTGMDGFEVRGWG